MADAQAGMMNKLRSLCRAPRLRVVQGAWIFYRRFVGIYRDVYKGLGILPSITENDMENEMRNIMETRFFTGPMGM